MASRTIPISVTKESHCTTSRTASSSDKTAPPPSTPTKIDDDWPSRRRTTASEFFTRPSISSRTKDIFDRSSEFFDDDDFFPTTRTRPAATTTTGSRSRKTINEFRITLNVSQFQPDEIDVKTRDGKVIIHAKHPEREDQYGLVSREFTRKCPLPEGVDVTEVDCSLSDDGVLTILAPQVVKEDENVERSVPIRTSRYSSRASNVF